MAGEFQRSIGLELGGSRNDRTAVAVADFFPKTNRLILVEVESGHHGHDHVTSDEALVQYINEFQAKAPQFTGIGMHGPASLPPDFEAALAGKKLPFPSKSRDPELLWMHRTWEKIRPRPKPFLPYLQRPAEIWLRYLTPEKFLIPDGMGANYAPLAARFQFLKPHLPGPVNEVLPRATLTRMVSSLGLPKNIFRLYTDLEKGITFREDFFSALNRKLPQIFIYEKDIETMILHLNCFQAFLAVLTQHLIAVNQTEEPHGDSRVRLRGFTFLALTWIGKKFFRPERGLLR